MTLTSDTYCNKAPMLVEVCSKFVAENGRVIFAKNRRKDSDASDKSSSASMEDSKGAAASVATMYSDEIVLPTPVSESLFNAFRRRAVDADADDGEVLQFYSDATKTPLWNLNLEQSKITDNVLANLLRQHGSNLLTLNLNECDELTESINYQTRRILTPKLHTLYLGSLIKIFGPWLVDNGEPLPSPSDDTTEAPPTLDVISDLHAAEDAEMSPSFMDADTFHEIPIKVFNYSDQNSLSNMDADDDDDDDEANSPSSSSDESSQLNAVVANGKPILTHMCPNLIRFTLHGDQVEDIINTEDVARKESLILEFFNVLFRPIRQLLYLDLSYWSSVNNLSFLKGLQLRCLILYEIPDLHKALDVICDIPTLEYLDISQSNQETGVYPLPATALDRVVNSLPNLVGLDITSTNLASNPTKGDWPPFRSGTVESDIVGLAGLKQRLNFLGIFMCDSASHYQRIPAQIIAGDGSEQQILVAIEKYLHRSTLLVTVLNEAYQVYRFGISMQHCKALHLMLDAMNVHLLNANIQIASSASIFYIIRNISMNPCTKKKVIAALLNAMDHHMQEQTLVRNCCLSLCQFDVPADILHDYERAVALLLRVLQVFNDQMTQRIVIYLLNSLACHVDGSQKITVGDIGAVSVILDVIRRRIESNVCDEVMEVSWSFLWNITDETPVNCERFLKGEGMELFQKCNEKFPDKMELLRNMMGLMGNIAEVKNLRHHLMKSPYVTVFCALLNNINDGIEISYNSAGVLAHMISDGDKAWTFDKPSRAEASAHVVKAIEHWQLNAKRFINYRSFEPIIRLLSLENSYASQYWAVWALANLTTVDGGKYCGFVVDEEGVPLLQAILLNPNTEGVLRDLAKKVLQNVKEHKGVDVL